MNIENIKTLDNLLDYIPVVSTVSNLVNLIAKSFFDFFSKHSIENSLYFAHLSQKSYMRCIILLIPVLGILTVFIYEKINDFSHQNPNEKIITSEILDKRLNKPLQNVITKEIEYPVTTLKNDNFCKKNKEEDRRLNSFPLQTIQSASTEEEEWIAEVSRNIELEKNRSSNIIGNEKIITSEILDKRLNKPLQNVITKEIEYPVTTLKNDNFCKKNKEEDRRLNSFPLQTIQSASTEEEEWIAEVSRNIELEKNRSSNIIGIDNGNETNPKNNCWCISVLQILCNTSLSSYITTYPSTLESTFPKIFEFIKTYKEGNQSSTQLGEKIKEIRLEISQLLGNTAFPSSENEEADAKSFLVALFEKMNLNYKIVGFENEDTNKKLNHSIFKGKKEPYLFIDSSIISMENLDADEIFDSTHYKLIGALRVEPGHYSALFQSDNIWYRCSDSQVYKLSETFPTKMLKKDRGIFLIAEWTNAINYTLTNLDD